MNNNQLNNKLQIKRRPLFYQIWVVNNNIDEKFIAKILKIYFHNTKEKTQKSINDLKNTGYSMCGEYTKDVAETKTQEIIKYANTNNKNIRIIIQKGVSYAIRKS